jgi:hypothetical protein
MPQPQGRVQKHPSEHAPESNGLGVKVFCGDFVSALGSGTPPALPPVSPGRRYRPAGQMTQTHSPLLPLRSAKHVLDQARS